MKYFIGILILLLAISAKAQWYYGSGEATNLENVVGFDKHLQKLISGETNDPSSSGYAAGEGSILMRNTGEAYVKTGALDTDWDKISTTATADLVSGNDGITVIDGDGATNKEVTVQLNIASATATGGLTAEQYRDFDAKVPRVFGYFNAEDNSVANWDTTNLTNATLTATSVALKGSYSYQLSNVTSSASEYACTPNVSVSEYAQSKHIGFKMAYNYDGDTDDMKVWMEDVTNGATISSEMLEAGNKDVLVAGYTQSTTNAVRACMQIYTENNGKNLRMDNLEFESNPLNPIKLRADAEIVYNGEISGSQLRTLAINNQNRILSSDNTTATVITFEASAQFKIVFNAEVNTLNSLTEILWKDSGGTLKERAADHANSNASNRHVSISLNGTANQGDTIEINNSSTGYSDSAVDTVLRVQAWKETDATVHSDNLESDYYRFSGGNGVGSTNTYIQRFTTVEEQTSGKYLKYEDDAILATRFTAKQPGTFVGVWCGYGSGGTFGGWTKNGTNLNSSISNSSDSEIVGGYLFHGNTETGCYSTTTHMNVGDIIRPHMGPNNANTSIYTWASVTFTPEARTVITPSTQECLLYDEKTDGTSGGASAAASWQTRDLNQKMGACAFVNLSANQFTLSAGTYKIEGTAPAHGIVNTNRARFYNTGDATYYGIPVNQQAGQLVAGTLAKVYYYVTLTDTQTYELRHWTQTAKAGDGLGPIITLAGQPEYYSQVKIERIK